MGIADGWGIRDGSGWTSEEPEISDLDSVGSANCTSFTNLL